MPKKVEILPSAERDLEELYDYLATFASPEKAGDYLKRIRSACFSLAEFSFRGSPRNDLSEGIRTLNFERRAIIAYRVDDDRVEIVRFFHAGRDYGEESFD